MTNKAPARGWRLTSSFILHPLSFAILSLFYVCLGSRPLRAAGIPEPGITLYGQVLADDDSLITQGRLVWTYTSQSGLGSFQVTVTTDLAPKGDGAGTTYSYSIHIPAEMAVGGMPVSDNRLPASAGAVTYYREATLDGAFTTILSPAGNTTAFGSADRGRVERVDLFCGINGPPDRPSFPSPSNGALLVPGDVALDWADSARAETYDLFLWQAGYMKPSLPTVAGLTASQFQPPTVLRPDTDYLWQVIARNSKGAADGPVWAFRTAFEGDLQKLLEHLLGKRSLTFEEWSQLNLNADGQIDIADLVLSLKRAVYRMPPAGSSALQDVQSEIRNPGLSSERSPLLDPITVVVGSKYLLSTASVPVTLTVDVLPNMAGVAGVNLHIETDPGVITFTAVRPVSPNPNEDLYWHCPHPGVLNVVFFTNPVNPVSVPSSSFILLDLMVTPTPSWTYSNISLTAAAVSDVNGISAPGVTRVDGCLQLPPPEASVRNWQLYY